MAFHKNLLLLNEVAEIDKFDVLFDGPSIHLVIWLASVFVLLANNFT